MNIKGVDRCLAYSSSGVVVAAVVRSEQLLQTPLQLPFLLLQACSRRCRCYIVAVQRESSAVVEILRRQQIQQKLSEEEQKRVVVVEKGIKRIRSRKRTRRTKTTKKEKKKKEEKCEI